QPHPGRTSHGRRVGPDARHDRPGPRPKAGGWPVTISWEAAGAWPVRVLIAGGGVLLAGRLLVALTRQPARRVWIGTAAVVAALVAIPLCLLPGWMPVVV